MSRSPEPKEASSASSTNFLTCGDSVSSVTSLTSALVYVVAIALTAFRLASKTFLTLPSTSSFRRAASFAAFCLAFFAAFAILKAASLAAVLISNSSFVFAAIWAVGAAFWRSAAAASSFIFLVRAAGRQIQLPVPSRDGEGGGFFLWKTRKAATTGPRRTRETAGTILLERSASPAATAHSHFASPASSARAKRSLERASGKTKSTGLVNPLGLTCVPATVSTTYAPPSRPSEPRSTRPGAGLGDARGAPGRTLRGLPGSPSFAVSSPASRSDTERPSVSEYPASIFSVACGEYRIHEAVSRTNTPTAVGLEQGLSGHISKAGGRGGGGWRARVAQTRGSRARSSLSSQKSKKEPI
mmetsp:Transcript_3425/g.15061  ORF Transcript_3425/g.15061 Transcript_3425/m.15061 type:complete len:357 (-) Transcript_3425:101-1171(-)